MEILSLIVFVVLAVVVSGLRSRIIRIEEELADLRTRAVPLVSSSSPSSPTPASAPAPLPPEEYIQTPLPRGAAAPSAFLTWFREDWLVKTGALLFFIGCVWFLSYAFANDWIGPMGQITLGLLFGAGLMVFGWFRMGSLIRQGSIFLALGSSVVVLTTYVARMAYDFFTPSIALSVMFLAILFPAVASYRAKTEWLAWMSVISAYVIPLMTVSRVVNELSLFTYLFLVTIGVLWLIFVTDWRRIFLTSLAAVTMYSLPFWTQGFIQEGGLLVFGFLFVVLFFLANLAGFLIYARDRRTSGVEIVGAVVNAVFLLGWVLAGVGDEWQSMVLVGWAITFLLTAYIFAVRIRQAIPFFVYAGVGVILIGIATALELDGPALTFALLLESTVTILLTQRFFPSSSLRVVAYTTFLVPVFLALESFAQFPRFPDTPFTAHVAVAFSTVVALAVIGLRAHMIDRFTETDGYMTWGKVFLTFAGVGLFVFVWDFLPAILPEVLSTQLSLLLSIVTGVMLYVKYQQPQGEGERALRFVGLLLVLFVVGHLLFIEVVGMDTVPRIITFFGIGLLLMGTAFIKKLRQ